MKQISKLRIENLFSKMKLLFKNLHKKYYNKYKNKIINDGSTDELIKILEFYIEKETKTFIISNSELNKNKYGSLKSFNDFKDYFEKTMYPELSDLRHFAHNFDKIRNILIKDSKYVLRSFYKLDDGNFLSGYKSKKKIPYLFELYVKDCSINAGFNQFTSWIESDFKWKKIIGVVFKEDNLTEAKFNRILRIINDSPNKISFIPKIVDIPNHIKNNKKDIIKVITNEHKINILSKDNSFEMNFDIRILNSNIIGKTARKAIIKNLCSDCNVLKEKISELDPDYFFQNK